MSIFRRTGDARAMLAHCKSLMAFEQKGGFAMVEGADWVPSACLKTGGFVAQNEEQRIKLQEAYLKVPEGITEDKHAAAEDLMLRLGDVKRLYGRKELDFEREMAETAALASAGGVLAQARLAAFQHPDAEEYFMDSGGENLEFIQFKLGEMQNFALLGAESGCECLMGSMVMCTGTPKDPKLLFSCGYGECIGGGFGGEAVEVEAHISQALKDAGVEGKLLPFEFLACLLKFALSPKRGPIQELAEQGDTESPTTPLLNKACKLIAPNGYRWSLTYIYAYIYTRIFTYMHR